jgi:hypothetical protein
MSIILSTWNKLRASLIWALLAVPIGFVYLMWKETYNWLIVDIPPKATVEELATIRGTFGDKFGAINALFSGLSIIGISAAIIYQHIELQITKKALSEEKEDRLRNQFEITFFHLVNALPASAEKIILGQLNGYDAIHNISEYTPNYSQKMQSSIKHHIYAILRILILITPATEMTKIYTRTYLEII